MLAKRISQTEGSSSDSMIYRRIENLRAILRHPGLVVVGTLLSTIFAALAEASPVVTLAPGYTADSKFPAEEPALAAQGKNVAILFRRGSLLWQTTSEDGGATFTPVIRFAPSFMYHRIPNRRAQPVYDTKGHLHVAWTVQDDQSSPRYVKSENHGATWSEAKLVGGGVLPRGRGPSFAIRPDGSALQTLAFDEGDSGVYTGRLQEGAGEWDARKIGVAAPQSSFASSAVLREDGRFHALVLWENELRVVSPDALPDVLEVQGKTISLANAGALRLALDGSLLTTYGRDGEVIFRCSRPDGSWNEPVVVASAAGGQSPPVLAPGGDGHLHVVWADSRSGCSQIHHAASSDGGATWVARSLLESPSAQTEPAITMDGDVPLVVWVENGSPQFVRLTSDAPLARAALPGEETARIDVEAGQAYLLKGAYSSEVDSIQLTGEWLDVSGRSLGSFLLALPPTQGDAVPFLLETRAPKANGKLQAVIRVAAAPGKYEISGVSLRPGTIRDHLAEFQNPALADNSFFPIFGWLGPVNGMLEQERHAEMALGPDVTEDRLAAEYALANFTLGSPATAAFGTKFTVAPPESDDALVTIAKDPMFWGFHGGDEPGEEKFPELAKVNARIQNLVPGTIYWVNMFPTYVFDKVETNVEDDVLKPYHAFLKSFLDQVKPRFFTYDHYCLVGGEGNWGGVLRAGDWFANLEIARDLAGKAGSEFGVIGSVGGDGHIRPANEAELRWQAFTPLAYGSRALGWYTYLTEIPYARFHDYDQVINRDGSRTRNYAMLRRINREVLAWAPTLLRLNSLGVVHGDPLPLRTRPVSAARFVREITPAPIVIGEFEDAEKTPWILVANREFASAVTVGITLRTPASAIQFLSRETGQLVPFEHYESETGVCNIQLPPGEAVLLRLAL